MAGEQDDALHHAEEQMAEHELVAFSTLFTKIAERVGLDAEHPATQAQIRQAMEQLIEEDPEACAAALALRGLREGGK